MRHLYLYVEGSTELTFADVVLRPHLESFQVYLEVMKADQSRSKGKVYKGGVTRYAPFEKGLRKLLAQHSKRADVTISTMIDLYALPPDFPGWNEAEKSRVDPYARVSHLEHALADDIEPNRSRFIPYIQLHEYEALLFAEPEQLALFYPKYPDQIAKIQQVIKDQPNPELINDGKHTAPSKRIIALLPDYDAAKPIAGPQVAERIGLPTLRGKCRHFSEWVQSLEQLGRPTAPAESD